MQMRVRVAGSLGAISVLALRDVLTQVIALLDDLDSTAGPGQANLHRDWVVTGLSEGSASVAIAAAHSTGEAVLPRALEAVRDLAERPVIPPGATETAIKKVIALHSITGRRGVTGIELSEVGDKLARVIPIGANVAANARKAIEVRSRTRSSFHGRLDKVNLRTKSPEFSLFDDARRVALRCHLAEPNEADLLATVKTSLGAIVSARGDLKRNSLGQAIHMRVDRLRVLEAPDRPICVSEIAGIAPDWTGGLDSVDFVRLQRGDSGLFDVGGAGDE